MRYLEKEWGCFVMGIHCKAKKEKRAPCLALINWMYIAVIN